MWKDKWADSVPADVESAAAAELAGYTKQITHNALGGLVTKSGIGWIDAGEPIVPAEINRNSHLINMLELIANGSSSNSVSGGNTINVTVDYNVTGGTGTGMYLDKFAFERAVKDIIGKCGRIYGGY